MRPESAQDQHNEMLETSKPKLVSKTELEASLNEASDSSSQPASSTAFDPIENAMKRHPGPTREKAEEMAKAFGF